MKKKGFVCLCFAALLALLLAFPTAAQEGPAAQENGVAEEYETAADGAQNSASPAATLADFILSHFADIAVTTAAVWLAFPKWGGVAVLVRLLRHIRTYFDDAGNSRSVYNLLAGNADAISRFMNDAAPLLADLREGRAALEQAGLLLRQNAELTEEQKALLQTAAGQLSALTEELWRLVAALPDTDEETRARFAALLTAGEEPHETTRVDV